MISYAQNFEDVMLRRVFRDRKQGFYIDVGAMDPVVESVTKFFYDEGWSGINIEPNEWFYSKLLQDRPRDINLNLAVGEREEKKELYLFERIGNSTFEQASRDRYVDRGYEAIPVPVNVTTLASICRDYVRSRIDFLKIDCEGWENFVLRGADWDRFRPTVVIVEATAPGTETPSWQEWEPYLIENGRYELVYFDGLNRFYVPRESVHLRSHFELPPNFHDGFKVHATELAEQHITGLQWHRDTLLAQVAELEEKLRGSVAANTQLSESLHAKIAVLEQDALHGQNRVVELEKQRQELEQTLLKARLWIGRLSQELAAIRQRQ
jgi:FkbM family methyltransferase